MSIGSSYLEIIGAAFKDQTLDRALMKVDQRKKPIFIDVCLDEVWQSSSENLKLVVSTLRKVFKIASFSIKRSFNNL